MTRIELVGCCCAMVLLTASSATLCEQLDIGMTSASFNDVTAAFLYGTPLFDYSRLSKQSRVSAAISKPLQAAQRAMQAKDFDEAFTQVKKAQSASGEKTAYDNYVIDVMFMQIYQGKNDQADLVGTLTDTAQSQYATTEQQKIWYKFIAQYWYRQKDYSKALDAAKQAQQHGATDAGTMDLIAKAQYLSENYAEAASMMREIVSQQERPSEDSLKLLWQFDLKAKDDAGAASAIEELVALYPKPEYWQIALAPLARMNIKDARLELHVYRLMSDVGTLKTSRDYDDMALIALDQGYPSEAASVLQEALQRNVFSEQRDKDRYQHLLDRSRQRAATDQPKLDKSEPADGDGLVQLGAAYMSYGRYDKAVANIQEGIARGDLKSSDEAYLLLGIAELRLNQTPDAQRAFNKVATSSDTRYSRLGALWAARSGSWLPHAAQH
jgi:hypothetical protein